PQYVDPHVLRSFPTRRSSDLDRVFCWCGPAFGQAREQNPADGGVSLNRDDGDVVAQVGQCESRCDGHAEADADHGLSFLVVMGLDRKSTRLNSSHLVISYAVF